MSPRAALLTLLDLHEALKCGDPRAHQDGPQPLIHPSLGELHQTVGPMPAAVYSCPCGWVRTVRLLMPDAIAVEVPC